MNEIVNVKLETLSYVHVGSGKILSKEMDYVVGGQDIGIVDLEKIAGVVGADNLDRWVANMNQTQTMDFLRNYNKQLKLSDISARTIKNYAGSVKTSTMREQIHDGRGFPYIPGSSIKGAIRTAILADLANNRNIDGYTFYDAKGFEKQMFGNDPNSDVFRFLQVGDAFFEKGTEAVIKLGNINIRNSTDEMSDFSKSQLVEVIDIDYPANFRVVINNNQYELARNRNALGNNPHRFNSISEIFLTINKHTEKLLKYEQDFWDVYRDNETVEDYLKQVAEMLEECRICSPDKECVLRLGHASGWRFITGAWSEALQNFKTEIVPKARPNNRRYEEYAFPKTRRLDDESNILGFVKLTLE